MEKKEEKTFTGNIIHCYLHIQKQWVNKFYKKMDEARNKILIVIFKVLYDQFQ